MPHGKCADRDPARSYERLDKSDLARLGRAAQAELDAFFARNPHLAGWRDRVRFIALAQGGAEHYLRGRRGVRDLDVIVCFAEDPRLPRLFRRMVISWDWGPSQLGRCPDDPPQYTGRAVDVVFWVIPDRPSAIAGLRQWLAGRAARKVDPERNPDLAHEPVVLICPDLGSVAWDPGEAPPPGQKQLGIASPMAWCRAEALRLTHHVQLAIGITGVVGAACWEQNGSGDPPPSAVSSGQTR